MCRKQTWFLYDIETYCHISTIHTIKIAKPNFLNKRIVNNILNNLNLYVMK